jgi:hypothetical protein
MKKLFPAYYKLEPKEIKTLWNEALIVFDTSMLLNFYRYQKSTKDDLVKVIKQLNGRIWLPYHVALEFQRNRLAVIAEQKSRHNAIKSKLGEFNKVEREIADLSKRHTHIQCDTFLEEIKKAKSNFIKTLDEQNSTAIDVDTSNDKIRIEIDRLFKASIGTPPTDQTEIDKIQKLAEKHHKLEIPPGYKDSDKNNHFYHKEIIYENRYGDNIILNQIRAKAIQDKIKYIIFVNDDAKEDFWYKVSGKTISVRPEIQEMMKFETEIKIFHSYAGDQFLKYAKEHLDTSIQQKSIDDAKIVYRKKLSQSNNNIHNNELFREYEYRNDSNKQASFRNFLEDNQNYSDLLPIARETLNQFLDGYYEYNMNLYDKYDSVVAVNSQGEQTVFDIKFCGNYRAITMAMRNYRNKVSIRRKSFVEYGIFIVITENYEVEKFIEIVKKYYETFLDLDSPSYIILGVMLNDRIEIIETHHTL